MVSSRSEIQNHHTSFYQLFPLTELLGDVLRRVEQISIGEVAFGRSLKGKLGQERTEHFSLRHKGMREGKLTGKEGARMKETCAKPGGLNLNF